MRVFLAGNFPSGFYNILSLAIIYTNDIKSGTQLAVNYFLNNRGGVKDIKILLAGGVTGNLAPLFKKIGKDMNVFFAGTASRLYLFKDNEKTFLAGQNSKERIMKTFLAGNYGSKDNAKADDPKGITFGSSANDYDFSNLYILESFYYLRNNTTYPPLIPYFGAFLLDSGAFTFMSGNHKGTISWDAYTEEYAAFINKYDIKLFFELDIDSIVGLKEVERLRKKLELLTGKKPIPVWHKSRGKDYFVKMCEEYPYVAIGGIVTKEIPTEKYEKAFPWFIKTAHEHNSKIHGLGYTRINNLKKYHFDSVDSTAWTFGNRGGYIYKFKPSEGIIIKIEGEKGKRLSSRAAALYNFNEWVKFQRWADKFL